MQSGTAVPVILKRTEGLGELLANSERDLLRKRLNTVLLQSDTLSTVRANRAMRVMWQLVGACDVEHRAIIQQATLAERIQSNVRTVQRALHDLEDAGLLERTRSTKRLRHRASQAEGASLYQILDPAAKSVVPDVFPASWSPSWRLKVAYESDTTPDESDTTESASDTTDCRTGHDRLSYLVVSNSYKKQEHSGDAEAAPAVASGSTEAPQHSEGTTPPAAASPLPLALTGSVSESAAETTTGDQCDVAALYRIIRSELPSLTPEATEAAIDGMRVRTDGLEKVKEVIDRAKAKTNPPGYFATAMRAETLNPSPARGQEQPPLKGETPLYHQSVAAVQAYYATLEANYMAPEPAAVLPEDERTTERHYGRVFVAMLKAGKSFAEVGEVFTELGGIPAEEVPAYVDTCTNAIDIWNNGELGGWQAIDAAVVWGQSMTALEYAAERSTNGKPFPATAIERQISAAEEEASRTITAELKAAETAHAAAEPGTPLMDQWQAAWDESKAPFVKSYSKLSDYGHRDWSQLKKHERRELLASCGFDLDGLNTAQATPEYQAELQARKAWNAAAADDRTLPGWSDFLEQAKTNPHALAHVVRWGADLSAYRLDIGREHGLFIEIWLMHVCQHFHFTVKKLDMDKYGNFDPLKYVQIGKRLAVPLTLEDAAEQLQQELADAYKEAEAKHEKANRDRDDY